jgi:hypothetical protein
MPSNDSIESTFTSTASFTRTPLCPGGLYFGANLVHGERFARHGTNLVQDLFQFLSGVPAAHFLGQQFRHPTVVQQTHLARLPDESFGQIQFNGNAHNALFFCQKTYTHRGLSPRTDLFAARCYENGVDIPALSQWLGRQYGGVVCMKTYVHL